MISTPRQDGADGAMFARTILNVAAEVEAAEAQIKQAIVDAATAGDCARVLDLMARWNSMPAVQVLAPNGLASMRRNRVTQDVPPGANGRE